MVLENYGLLHALWLSATTSPSWTFCLTFAITCCVTRVVTGFTSSSSDGAPVRKVEVVPYWIPFLGHIPSLFTLNASLRIARDRAKASVFALRFGPTKHNIIYTPSLTKALFHPPPGFTTNDSILWHIMESIFGAHKLDKDVYDPLVKALHQCDVEGFLRTNALAKVVDVTVRGIEQNVAQLISRALSSIDSNVWERAALPSLVRGCESTAAEASLFPLVRDFVGTIATPSVYGTSLIEQESILDDLWILDYGFHLLAMGLPRWLPIRSLSQAYAARDRLLRHFTRFGDAMDQYAQGDEPSGEWGDLTDVSEVINSRNKTMREAGLPPKTRASYHLAYFWAMNANANNLVFWMVLRICATPGLLECVRNELAPYATVLCPATGFGLPGSKRVKLDADGISRSCPVLKACFWETLRLHSSIMTVQHVQKDLVVIESAGESMNGNANSYLLEAGTFAATCHGLHQSDPRYYERPDQFLPDRFLTSDKNKDGVKVKEHTLAPFGGGNSICPGRLYAATETTIFTAAILTCWDIEPVGSKGWVIPANQDATGVSRPAKDVRVMLRSRVE